MFGNGAFFAQAGRCGRAFVRLGIRIHLGMLWLIDRFMPVKVDQAAEESGLDAALHGETAYLGTN
jgi:ammonia channel protein AmtB